MARFPATTLRAAATIIPVFLATAIVAPTLLMTATTVPASAQFRAGVSFDEFYDRLSPYGTWGNHPRWGDVWRPRVERGFRPYYNGYWVDTNEYGYLWVSEERWGDIPYHYGRWVFEPGDGWLWVPGYVWGPAWVVWRSGGGNIGWFPMPPGDNYYGDGSYRDGFDDRYGYTNWYGPSFGETQFLSLWIFVGEDHFRDRNYHNFAVPQRDYNRFIFQTRNVTNYVTINNYVVNRSIDGARFQRGTNRPTQSVPANSVIGRDASATQATIGRQIEQRERQRRPIPININPAEQRGRGTQNLPVQQPNAIRPPQDIRNQGPEPQANPNNQERGNPQPERGRPVTIAPRPNNNAVPQGPARLDRGQAAPETPANPPADGRTRVNQPPERGNQAIQTQPRGAQTPNGNAVRQDASPRGQGNAPAAAREGGNQGNAEGNRAQGNNQNDARIIANRKAAEDKKRPTKKRRPPEGIGPKAIVGGTDH